MSIFLFSCSNVFPLSPWSCRCVVETLRAFIPLLSCALEIQALSQTCFVFYAYFRLETLKKAFQIAHHNLPSKCLAAVFYSHVSHSSVPFSCREMRVGHLCQGWKPLFPQSIKWSSPRPAVCSLCIWLTQSHAYCMRLKNRTCILPVLLAF